MVAATVLSNRFNYLGVFLALSFNNTYKHNVLLNHYIPVEEACIGLKLGPEGSLLSLRQGFKLPGGEAVVENKVWRESIGEIKPVDTTGAGDAFNGGFLASFLKKESPTQWLKTANALAAEVIKRQGAATFYFEKGF